MILSVITNDPVALLLPTKDQLKFEFSMKDTNVITNTLGIQMTIKGVGKIHIYVKRDTYNIFQSGLTWKITNQLLPMLIQIVKPRIYIKAH
jgi:hypothetical protein